MRKLDTHTQEPNKTKNNHFLGKISNTHRRTDGHTDIHMGLCNDKGVLSFLWSPREYTTTDVRMFCVLQAPCGKQDTVTEDSQHGASRLPHRM